MAVSVYLLSITWKWQQEFLSRYLFIRRSYNSYRLNSLGSFYTLSACGLQSMRHEVFFVFFILPSVFCSIAWIPYSVIINIRLISVAWVLLVSNVTSGLRKHLSILQRASDHSGHRKVVQSLQCKKVKLLNPQSIVIVTLGLERGCSVLK